MIIIKSLTNQVSVNHLNLLLWDVIRAPVYCAVRLMVQSTREEICSRTPSSTTTSVDLCINRVTSCSELSGPSNDVTHSSNFRMYPWSLRPSLSLSHTQTDTHSQLGSLQLVPMVIIINHHPSVCLWPVWAPMAIAVCYTYKFTGTNTQTDLKNAVWPVSSQQEKHCISSKLVT